MNFTPYFIEQRTSDWFRLRIGLLTGSAADAIIAVRKRGSGELKVRTDLRRRLVCERLTGLSAEGTYKSDAMQRGSDLEPLAFAAYEAATGQVVHRVGFIAHNELKAGCSPDGYVANWEGLVELKCPLSTTHLEYLQAGALPEEYRGQCIHALWLTGARWIDFCSFDDRFPEHLQLVRVRMERDDTQVAAYELMVRTFLSEVDAELDRMRSLEMARDLTEVLVEMGQELDAERA